MANMWKMCIVQTSSNIWRYSAYWLSCWWFWDLIKLSHGYSNAVTSTVKLQQEGWGVAPDQVMCSLQVLQLPPAAQWHADQVNWQLGLVYRSEFVDCCCSVCGRQCSHSPRLPWVNEQMDEVFFFLKKEAQLLALVPIQMVKVDFRTFVRGQFFSFLQ